MLPFHQILPWQVQGRTAAESAVACLVAQVREIVGKSASEFSDLRIERLLRKCDGDCLVAAELVRRHVEFRQTFHTRHVSVDVLAALQSPRFRHLGFNQRGLPVIVVDSMNGRFVELDGGIETCLHAYVVFLLATRTVAESVLGVGAEPDLISINIGGVPPYHFMCKLAEFSKVDFPECVSCNVMYPIPKLYGNMTNLLLNWLPNGTGEGMQMCCDPQSLLDVVEATDNLIPPDILDLKSWSQDIDSLHVLSANGTQAAIPQEDAFIEGISFARRASNLVNGLDSPTSIAAENSDDLDDGGNIYEAGARKNICDSAVGGSGDQPTEEKGEEESEKKEDEEKDEVVSASEDSSSNSSGILVIGNIGPIDEVEPSTSPRQKRTGSIDEVVSASEDSSSDSSGIFVIGNIGPIDEAEPSTSPRRKRTGSSFRRFSSTQHESFTRPGSYFEQTPSSTPVWVGQRAFSGFGQMQHKTASSQTFSKTASSQTFSVAGSRRASCHSIGQSLDVGQMQNKTASSNTFSVVGSQRASRGSRRASFDGFDQTPSYTPVWAGESEHREFGSLSSYRRDSTISSVAEGLDIGFSRTPSSTPVGYWSRSRAVSIMQPHLPDFDMRLPPESSEEGDARMEGPAGMQSAAPYVYQPPAAQDHTAFVAAVWHHLSSRGFAGISSGGVGSGDKHFAAGVTGAKPARKGKGRQTLSDVPVESRTSVTLQNMPYGYSRLRLQELLDQEGFAGQYNFIYIPYNMQLDAFFDYALVNMVSHDLALKLQRHFHRYSSWMPLGQKPCQAFLSHRLQGYGAHVERYRGSPVMHESVPDERKPAVFQNGDRVPMPPPLQAVRKPKVRNSPSAMKFGAKRTLTKTPSDAR